jgi:voltage-gated potassium channel
VTFFGAAVLINLLFLRAFRLFRIFRVFKLGRYHDSFETIKRVLSKKRGELFVTAFVGIVLLVVASSAMYYAENGAQPDKFSSIPATMWWGVETLTTIGYGDMYPVTRVGQFLAALIAALGIGLFALPAGILGSGFYEEFHHGRQKDETITCPHCGKEITKR